MTLFPSKSINYMSNCSTKVFHSATGRPDQQFEIQRISLLLLPCFPLKTRTGRRPLFL
jgi:hypothetical protein